MNCKPGDLARIIHPDAYGRLVDVMHAAPIGIHTLPNRQPAETLEPGRWVCRILGSPLPANIIVHDRKVSRLTNYGVIADVLLRPIRDPGDDAVDEMVQKLGVPGGVTA